MSLKSYGGWRILAPPGLPILTIVIPRVHEVVVQDFIHPH